MVVLTVDEWFATDSKLLYFCDRVLLMDSAVRGQQTAVVKLLYKPIAILSRQYHIILRLVGKKYIPFWRSRDVNTFYIPNTLAFDVLRRLN